MSFADDAPPLINDFTSPFGALTAVGRGNVRFADVMMDPASGPIDSWTATLRSGIPTNHFETAANAALGRTPAMAQTGFNTQLSHGTYVWDVTAIGPGGQATAVLIHIAYANATMLGTPFSFDNYGGAILYTRSAATFCQANQSAPKKILLAVGADRGPSGLNFGQNDFNFPDEVRIEHADPARPSPLAVITIGPGNRNFTIEDLALDGAAAVDGARVGVISASKIKIRNCKLGRDLSSYVVGCAGVRVSGSLADDILIENIEARHQQRGVEILQGTNIRVRDSLLRYCHGQGVAFGPALRAGDGSTLPPPNGILVEDVVIASPYLTANDMTTHLDGIQQLDDFEGYVELQGGYVGAPTGVAENVTIRNVIICMADANNGWSAYRGGRAGEHSASDNFKMDNVIITSWSPYALEISNSAGASHINNVAVWRSNTGDDSGAQPGSRMNEFGGIGPNLSFTGRTALNWLSPMTVTNVHVYDDKVASGTANPAYGANVVAYDRIVSAIEEDYVVNPRTYLEAISNAAYAAMGKEELRTAHKLAFRRFDGTGPVDATGEWSSLLPATFDSTVTTFDNTNLTWDRT